MAFGTFLCFALSVCLQKVQFDSIVSGAHQFGGDLVQEAQVA